MIINETVFQIQPAVLGAIPIIIGLVQGFKGLGLPSRWAFPVSLVLGVAILAIVGFTWPVFLIQGIILGLMASGLYSGGKATFTPAV